MSDNTGAPRNSSPPAAAGGGSTSTPPVNITELEIALARDPGSDAFIPLCEAYLAQSRFMEAMVLGKKAVKAKPEDKTRRLLLARVYGEQGKMAKAIEEVQALLKVDANHAPAHVVLGRYLDKDGKKDLAIAAFKTAVDLDDNADAKAALSVLGVTYEKPKPEPPPPPPAPPPPVAPAMAPASTAQVRPRMTSTGMATQAAPRTSGMLPRVPSGDGAASTTAMETLQAPQGSMTGGQPVRRRRPAAALTEEDLGITPKSAPPASGIRTTALVGIVGFFVVGAIIIGMTLHRSRTDALARLSKPAREALGMDSLPSLRKAQQGFEEMLKVDSDQPLALASLAYIRAIYFAQYSLNGEKEAAEKAVTLAERDAKDTSLTHVARSMLLVKTGKASEAEDLLKKIGEKLGESPTSLLGEGDAAAAQGKMEEAGKFYQSARERSGAKEVRAYWAFGEFLRQVGREREALGNLDSVLRVDSEHHPARLARTLIRLDFNTSADAVAAQTDIVRLGEHPEQLGPYYSALTDVARVELWRQTGTPPPGVDPKKFDAKIILEDAKKTLGANHPDLVMVASNLEVDHGKPAEAAKMLAALVAKNPSRITAQLAYARALIADGKYQEAEAAMEKAQSTGGKNLELAIMVGIARREKKDFKGSEDAFKKAFELARDHPKVQLELARTLTEEKKFPEALKLLQSAIEGASDRPSLLAEVFCQTAATLLAKGDDKLGAQSLEEASKVEPNFAPIHYWRGMLLKGKTPADARASFQKYLDKAPRGEFAVRATRERDALK